MAEIRAKYGQLYQWDTNRKILVEKPADGRNIHEVHFYNGTTDNALVVEPEEADGVITAPVPNVLLQSASDLHVYVVVKNEGGEQTIMHRSLRVQARAKPDDYVYTETEIKRYETLENEIEAIRKLIEQGGTGGQIAKIKLESFKFYPWEIEEPGYYEIVSATTNMESYKISGDADSPSVKVDAIFNVPNLHVSVYIFESEKNKIIIMYALEQTFGRRYYLSKTANTWETTIIKDDLPTPANASDWVNKGYVDSVVATKITSPETATEGQLLKVKSVDESGKPTEWETVELKTETLTFVLEDDTEITKEVYVK